MLAKLLPGRLLCPSARFSSILSRPAPPTLPRDDQREFEDLVRRAQPSSSPEHPRHPDAPEPLQQEFEGDTNPVTGEQGGPKREPVHRWIDGDWSFKGRVSDF
ncbi:hypothetical protein AX14_013381 [Amanita brunnescens Koide BX004]|nr:hypothetical protein AX14_013381 [Amanita brunnescens Koide BX004]